MANKIQIKRGLESNINKSNLLQGELAVTTDSNKLYVGTSKGPIQLNKDDESLVIIDYYETDESKKEKIKSLFIKEDGAPSEHQLVKPCILLAPTVEPTSTTSIYTKGQWICAFGDTESNLINELTNERAITKYNLIFMTMDMGLNLIYNVSEDTITYTWMENALEATYNKITKIGTPETINDKHYPSEKAVYDYVNEKVVQSDYNQITYSRFNVNTDITNKDIVLVDSDGGLFKTLKGLNLGINNPKTLVENLDSSLGITVSKSENSDIIFNMKKGSVSTPMIRVLLSDTGYTFDPNYPNVIKFTDKFVPNYISSSNTSFLDYLLIKNEKTLFLSDKENLSNKIKVLGGCDKDISNDYYIGAKDILDIMSGTYLDQDSNTTLLTENSIDFTTLSPGRYKFKASNPTDGYLRFVLYLKESTAGSLPYDSYISGRDINNRDINNMGIVIDDSISGNANTDRSEFTMYVTRSYSPDLPDGTLFAYILLDHSNITEPNQVLGFFKQTEGNYSQVAHWNNMYAETASLTGLDQQAPSEYVLSDEDRKYAKITDIYDISFAKDTGWITSTVSQSNGVCTYNAPHAGGELQMRKVGKIVYLNLALRLNLMPDTTQSDQYLLTLNEKYRPTQKIYFTTVITCNGDLQFNELCTVTISPNGKVELPNYVEIARKQIEIGGSELYLNHLVSYPV